VVVRLFCICSMLLPVFAGGAFGEGTYQRTKDGKTIVWNNDPKPGDAATWFGDRDGERYATKVGTLTWYTADGAVYARYFGNMVRGKFDGMVNVHSKRKTNHAIFVDGQRTTRWAAGRAPSWRVAQSRAGRPAKPAVAAEAPAERPPTVRETENALATASSSSGEQHPALSATPALSESRMGRMGPTDLRNATARQAPNSQNFREQAAQRPIEDTPAKELSEQRAPPANPAATAEPASAGPFGMAEPEAPAEGPRVVQAEGALATASSSLGEQPATSNSESFREQAAQPPMEDTASVLIEPSKKSVPTPPTSKKSEAEIEDSLQSLVGPPLSLLVIPETAGSPEASPRLTKEEVINIANAKAHAHGYNRADYQRAEPQYNASYKIWSVSYEQRAADGMEEAGKHFSVIVDDKTKGTVFLLRR
jgi:hypothetical protein